MFDWQSANGFAGMSPKAARTNGLNIGAVVGGAVVVDINVGAAAAGGNLDGVHSLAAGAGRVYVYVVCFLFLLLILLSFFRIMWRSFIHKKVRATHKQS